MYHADEFVRMDAATRRNLEITQTLRGEPAPTLLSLLDTCATNMGSRLLANWLHHPLRNREILRARLDAVDELDDKFSAVHEQLKPCVDVERITARIALKSARPRDLSGLRDTLKQLPQLHTMLAGVSAPRIKQLAEELNLSAPAPTLFVLSLSKDRRKAPAENRVRPFPLRQAQGERMKKFQHERE